MLALNIQLVIRKKSKLASGKTFLGHRNTFSDCPGSVVSLGQQGKVPLGNTLIPLPQRVEMYFFPQEDIHLHVLGDLLYVHSHMFSYRRQQSSFSILGMAKLQSPTSAQADNRASTSVMPGTPHSYTGAAPSENWTKHQPQKVSSAEQLPTSVVRKTVCMH